MGGSEMQIFVSSGAASEETTDARPAESGAGGPGDAVSLWTAGPPHQGTDAAGRMHQCGLSMLMKSV